MISGSWAQGSSRRWRDLRATILRRDADVCQIRTPGTWPVGRRGETAHCLVAADCVDHVVPLSKGGARYDPGNLRAACTPCNLLRAAQARADRRPRSPGVVVTW